MTAALAFAGWMSAAVLLVAVGLQRRAVAANASALMRISHELRAPLTAVGLALSGEGEERRSVAGHPPARADIRAVRVELDCAAAVLGDLDALVAGRQPTGAPRAVEPVALDELVADAVRAWMPFAERHSVRLLPCHPAAEALIVLGDPARLVQASGNLIANAVEHGGGVVRVRCRCGSDTVCIEVADDGPGLSVPPGEIIVSRARRDGRGRRGHGLTIAATVAAAHGGRLCSAPAQRGARLVLELPRIALPPA